MKESGAWIADHQSDSNGRENNHPDERGPQTLLAVLQIAASDTHLPHISSAASKPGATRFRSAPWRILSAAWDARGLHRARPRPHGWLRPGIAAHRRAPV